MALAGWTRTARATEPAATPAAQRDAVASPAVVQPAGTAGGTTSSEASAVDPHEKAGREALARASHFLDEGEKASNDDDRRRIYEIAATHADRAVELLPDDPEAHFVRFGARGRLAQLQGLAGAALHLRSLNRELDEVLRLDPDHADALAARGGMLVKLPRLLGGNTKEGIRYLEKAVALDPRGAGKRLELAQAYHTANRDAEAMRSARQALALARENRQPAKAAQCEAFIADLEKSCDRCGAAAGG